MTRLRTFWPVASLIAFLAFPTAAEATPQDLFGFGARSPAMAMTGVAHSRDYEAAFLNPAGLARAQMRSLHVGVHAGTFQLRLDDERFVVEPSRGLLFGFQLPLPFGGILSDRLVLGGAFYTPTDALLKGTVAFPEAPQFPVLERTQAASAYVSLGVALDDLLPGLAVGAGLIITANLIGELLVRLDETNAFSSQVESELMTSYGPILGATYARGDLTVGIAYRHRLKGEMDLEVEVQDLPLDVPDINVGGIMHYDPPSLSVEAALEMGGGLVLVANLTTRFWGAYDGPQRKSSASSYLAPDPEFSNVISPRVAAEWSRTDGRLELHLRGGYAYEPTPSPPARMALGRDSQGRPRDERVPLRYFDNDRHILSTGLGLAHTFADGQILRFDLYGQAHLLWPRDHAIGVLESGGSARTRGTVIAGGWTMGLSF